MVDLLNAALIVAHTVNTHRHPTVQCVAIHFTILGDGQEGI